MNSLTPVQAATLADEAETLAFVDLYAAAPAALRDRLGLQVERVGDTTLLLAPGLPTPMFNRAIGLGLGRAADLEAVHAVRERYRQAGVSGWWLHWNPHGTPSDMPAQLRVLGFTQPPRRSWAKMLRQSNEAPRIATDLTVAAAGPAQVGAVVAAIAAAFEMPPFMADWMAALHGRPAWRTYAITDATDVVGGGFLFLAGELAWLGMGAVATTHRRRGGQGALMALRIADAIAAGARLQVTETGEPISDEPNPSLANMYRCDFDLVASRLNFVAP